MHPRNQAIFAILCIAIAIVPLSGFASQSGSGTQVGISAGINWTQASGPLITTGPYSFSMPNLSGVGFAAAGKLSLFQKSAVGLGVGVDYVHYDIDGMSVAFNGDALIASALLHLNVHFLAHYHTLGIGYAFWDLLSHAANVGSVASTSHGFVIEGKDYLIAERMGGPFLSARAFMHSPKGSIGPFVTLNVLVGYDF